MILEKMILKVIKMMLIMKMAGQKFQREIQWYLVMIMKFNQILRKIIKILRLIKEILSHKTLK